MTDVAVARTTQTEPVLAGRTLGERLIAAFAHSSPQVVIVFASPRYYDYTALLRALHAVCQPAVLVGCSSAGEFTADGHGEASACALALRAPDMQFSAVLRRGLRTDRAAVAAEVAAGFRGLRTHRYLYRTALLLTDALAGYADDLVERLTVLTGGTYQFVGGGAGDDAQFQRTHVFCGTEAVSDAVVALEILSNKPLGVGVGHGWQPASLPLRVTEAEGMHLRSLNAAPAVEVFEEHAATTGQPFHVADPLPFFLHNVIGVSTGDGYKLRVPLGVLPDGGIACAAEVPAGATTYIMGTTVHATAGAAARAAQAALAQLHGARPKAALLFDCAATRLRMGHAFGDELDAVHQVLGDVSFAGCNTYGQIARAPGQFSGFHNCTAVVCVIPD